MQTHARHFLHNTSFHHKSFNITVVMLILDTSEVPCVKHLGFILLIISTLTKMCFHPHLRYKRGSLHHCTEVVTPWGPWNYENKRLFAPS